MSNEAFTLIMIIAISVLFVVVVYISCSYMEEELKNLIREKGRRYNKLLELNAKYTFFTDIEKVYYYREYADSKYKLDKFDFDTYFVGVVEKNIDFFKSIREKIENNRKQYLEYEKEIQELYEYDLTAECKEFKVPYHIYREIESIVFEEGKIIPVTKVLFLCSIGYVSPKGRNRYKREIQYRIEDLDRIYKRIEDKKFYKESRQYQRKIMSKSLRYDILRRDGFKCVLCGRSAEDGIVLHVDHIVPVSKGGKSEMSNLRTLCADCNLGKSDKYE